MSVQNVPSCTGRSTAPGSHVGDVMYFAEDPKTPSAVGWFLVFWLGLSLALYERYRTYQT
jgi:hypothetical protein